MATKTKRAALKVKPRTPGKSFGGPNVLVGTGREISAYLRTAPERRALAVTFESEREFAAAEEVYRRVGEVLPQLIQSRQKERLTKVVEALLPEPAPSRAALAQARMQAEAKSQVLESGDFLRAAEIAKLAGYSENNPSAQPNKWKRDDAIFAIEHGGVDYFPLFGLNPERNYKPYAAMRQVLEAFHGTKSGWGLAFWFAALNSFLDDRRPQDLLATEPEQVVAAAKDEMEGVQHG